MEPISFSLEDVEFDDSGMIDLNNIGIGCTTGEFYHQLTITKLPKGWEIKDACCPKIQAEIVDGNGNVRAIIGALLHGSANKNYKFVIHADAVARFDVGWSSCQGVKTAIVIDRKHHDKTVFCCQTEEEAIEWLDDNYSSWRSKAAYWDNVE